jgi:hypothetical protein
MYSAGSVVVRAREIMTSPADLEQIERCAAINFTPQVQQYYDHFPMQLEKTGMLSKDDFDEIIGYVNALLLFLPIAIMSAMHIITLLCSPLAIVARLS